VKTFSGESVDNSPIFKTKPMPKKKQLRKAKRMAANKTVTVRGNGKKVTVHSSKRKPVKSSDLQTQTVKTNKKGNKVTSVKATPAGARYVTIKTKKKKK
jgi:hypothetical protein